MVNMKTLLLLVIASTLYSQVPTGTITVASGVTATAGTLVCVGTATVAASVSTMHMKCTDGAAVVLPDIDFTVAAPSSTMYSVQRGVNTITWMLTKGNPIPDQWQVTANGVMKSGTF